MANARRQKEHESKHLTQQPYLFVHLVQELFEEFLLFLFDSIGTVICDGGSLFVHRRRRVLEPTPTLLLGIFDRRMDQIMCITRGFIVFWILQGLCANA